MTSDYRCVLVALGAREKFVRVFLYPFRKMLARGGVSMLAVAAKTIAIAIAVNFVVFMVMSFLWFGLINDDEANLLPDQSQNMAEIYHKKK